MLESNGGNGDNDNEKVRDIYEAESSVARRAEEAAGVRAVWQSQVGRRVSTS